LRRRKKLPETNPDTHTTETPTHPTIHTNVEPPKQQHPSPKKNENIFDTNKNFTTGNTKQSNTKGEKFNTIQNVESFFQQTLDRESEVNKLLEDEKGSKKTLSFEDFLEHFMKGVQVCHKVNNLTVPATKVPEKRENVKGQSSQQSFERGTTSSTNKNFPQKSPFGGQQQHYPEYMGYGQHPMMYPWIPNPEMNPQLYQQYQQMMPMFYQMFNPMMYQQQGMPETEYTEGGKGGQKTQPKNYGMPMPQMGYMNPNFSGENQGFYGGSQKGEENQSQFPSYYYGGGNK